jgi:DNA-binding LacI/PurR family transcriptional regulator
LTQAGFTTILRVHLLKAFSSAMPRTTIIDVARQAGVSIATVSRVLNGTAPVDAATAERVRLTVAELSYIPHAAARTLASRRTNTIGLVLPQIQGAFFQPLVRGVEEGARENGFNLLIHTTRNPNLEHLPSQRLAEHNTDGLLAFTNSLDDDELARLEAASFPLVLLYQTPPAGLKIPYVTIENQAGARDLVDHLIRVHGRRRIVYLKGPAEHEDSEWREKGYREALKTHGIPFDPRRVRTGGFYREDVVRVLQEIHSQGLDFDAVFAGDDDAAIGAYQFLRQSGVRIPQDVSVVGFDDQFFASTLIPPLTTVRAPTEQVGREAACMLVALLQGQPVDNQRVLPVEVILRESCGCPAIHNPTRSTNEECP